MALAETRQLNLILKLRDDASKTLQDFNVKIKKMKPAFKKMAIAGTAAFGAISLVTKGAIDQAAKAEGSYNKFNTVFADGADDMLKFVKELREKMPSATSEIVRMAADLQDLLVPMGLSREKAKDMSKGFLDVANKIAAFNDAEPTEVLEAIKSGLTGSSEPLKRFGINALETALEARAMKDGLLKAGESFKDLEPEVKTQIRSQALLAQVINDSSDAINGFEENNDSFIRRQQELNATIKETEETIGNAILPIMDELLKKLLPVIDEIADWTRENPELTKNIIIATGAIAGLVAILGTLGLILPSVITGLKLTAGGVKGLTNLIANPVGLAAVITTLTAVAIYNAIQEFAKLQIELEENAKLIQENSDKLDVLQEKARNFSTAEARKQFQDSIDKAREANNEYKKLQDRYEGIGGAFIAVYDTIADKLKSGNEMTTNFWKKLLGFSSGGIVPEYFASGGIAKGKDTVPAMLTPGEMILNKEQQSSLFNLLSNNGNGNNGNNRNNITVNINGGTYLDRNAGQKLADILGENLRMKLRLT